MSESDGRMKAWALAAVPLVLLAALLVLIFRMDPGAAIRGDAPPVEVVTFQRVALTESGFDLDLLNDGPDPVQIAQVMIDEAYWSFSLEPKGELQHLERARMHIPYPWVEGEVHEIVLITASGVTFAHEIEVALETPRPSGRYVWLFALIGLYVGVIPVALGLLWLPLMRQLGRKALDFVLALTIGLLVFLLLDTLHEGLEIGGEMAASYQGFVLFFMAAVLAFVALESLGAWLRSRHAESDGGRVAATLVAIGIGLHNLAEGLAIGAAFALGEAALGTLLIVGFTLHNTTEGLAIVAPLSASKVSIPFLLSLGLIAGAPTILGAWIGGFVYSSGWSVFFLALGAGALAQVIVQITRGVAGQRGVPVFVKSGAAIAGLTTGFALMYLTGMMIG